MKEQPGAGERGVLGRFVSRCTSGLAGGGGRRRMTSNGVSGRKNFGTIVVNFTPWHNSDFSEAGHLTPRGSVRRSGRGRRGKTVRRVYRGCSCRRQRRALTGEEVIVTKVEVVRSYRGVAGRGRSSGQQGRGLEIMVPRRRRRRAGITGVRMFTSDEAGSIVIKSRRRTVNVSDERSRMNHGTTM